ncbi:MAG: histidine phosphatase family protein [Actinomycetota bacterium]
MLTRRACYTTSRPLHRNGPEGAHATIKSLELRRHARRDPNADRLSPEGRAQAEDVGRELPGGYTAAFVSPAQRAAETLAWFLRGRGEPLPADHAVVPGLAGAEPGDPSPEGMSATVRALLDQMPEGGRALAVSHTPLIEHAAEGLTGSAIEALAECEGILVTTEGDVLRVEELRTV